MSSARVVHLGAPGAPAAPAVIAASAFNGLGRNLHQSWAFWRAELSPIVETPFRCVNGEQASMMLIRTLSPRLRGFARIAAITRRALDELHPAVEALPPGTRLAVLLGAPERTSASPTGKEELLRAVQSWLGSSEAKPPVLVEQGHAAFGFALLQAVELLASRTAGAVIVGGADSYYDPVHVEELISEFRIFDTANVETFIPGEGAAFLLLVGPDLPGAAESPIRLASVGLGEEPAPADSGRPCIAAGLGGAMRAVCQRLRSERRSLDWLWSDVTGEPYRAHEWGLAFPRAVAPGGLDTAGKDFVDIVPRRPRVDFVPECFGDLGAASMATAAAVAFEGFRRGAPEAATCLITGSSRGPSRAAALFVGSSRRAGGTAAAAASR